MKRLPWLALLLPLAAGAAERTITLKISGWHSKGDGYKTEQALRAVKGVQSATAETGSKELKVLFDDTQVSQAQLEKAVADAGYSVAK